MQFIEFFVWFFSTYASAIFPNYFLTSQWEHIPKLIFRNFDFVDLIKMRLLTRTISKKATLTISEESTIRDGVYDAFYAKIYRHHIDQANDPSVPNHLNSHLIETKMGVVCRDVLYLRKFVVCCACRFHSKAISDSLKPSANKLIDGETPRVCVSDVYRMLHFCDWEPIRKVCRKYLRQTNIRGTLDAMETTNELEFYAFADLAIRHFRSYGGKHLEQQQCVADFMRICSTANPYWTHRLLDTYIREPGVGAMLVKAWRNACENSILNPKN